MSLWRVTCRMEERYVVAASLDAAIATADKEWLKAGKSKDVDPRWAVIRVDMVNPDDPWK
jgi:hypothetical protein